MNKYVQAVRNAARERVGVYGASRGDSLHVPLGRAWRKVRAAVALGAAGASLAIPAFAVPITRLRTSPPVMPPVTSTPASRNLLTTEYRNNTPSVTLRASQLSAVTTSILPLESLAYFHGDGGFEIVSVTPIVGSAFDSASCTVSFSAASCTDTAAGSNATIQIVGDPYSNYVGHYRTFKVTYGARDPRANDYIYNPVRTLAVLMVLSDYNFPQTYVQQYVLWMPQP